jgi:hypothetical protein
MAETDSAIAINIQTTKAFYNMRNLWLGLKQLRSASILS